MPNTDQKPQKYRLTAEVEFDITATSIPAAYAMFTKWMADAFNAAFESPDGGGIHEPPLVPAGFEGRKVEYRGTI